MPCFCYAPTQTLLSLPPTPPLRIVAIPPQLAQLAQLLGLEPAAAASARADMRLAQALPDTTPDAWMRMTLRARAPGIPLPLALPSGAGPLVSALAKVRLYARLYPMGATDRLIAEIRQALASFAAGPGRAAAPLRAMVTPDFLRLTEAARATLALRAQGLCPLALAGVDGQFVISENLDDPRSTYASAMRLAVGASAMTPRPFALSPAQAQLAGHFAAMAQLDTLHEPLGLPPLHDPGFPSAATAMINALAQIPAPRLPLSPAAMLDLAGVMEAIDTIKQAFGDDALTHAGTARVNAMLRYVARLSLPRPGAALALQEQLDLLPPFETVEQGAQAARASAAGLAASMVAKVPDIPLTPVLDALTAVAATMERLFPPGAHACDFPIEDFLPASASSALGSAIQPPS